MSSLQSDDAADDMMEEALDENTDDDETKAECDLQDSSNASSSSEEEDDAECNATAEEDESSQDITTQENKKEYADLQQQDAHISDKITEISEYTVAYAQVELHPVNLPLVELNVAEKTRELFVPKPTGKSKFCPTPANKENTDSFSIAADDTKENGAKNGPNSKASCDTKACDESKPDDDTNDTKRQKDNDGKSSGADNKKEGGV